MIQTAAESEGNNLMLAISPTLALKVTAEQFEELAKLNDDWRLERSADGDLIANLPTGWETGKRNLSLSRQLGNWYEEHPERGEAFDSSTGFQLPNGAQRSPDASWVSKERLTPAALQGTFARLCPDFVVELRSRSDRLRELQNKLQEYLENGAQLGWLIDPQRQQVEIYRPGKAVEARVRPEELSGENILPGFVLKLTRFWA